MSVRLLNALLALSSVLVLSSCDDGDSPTTPSDPVVIGTQSLSEAIEGQAYAQQLVATGGSGGYSWVLDAGSLPAGLTLAPAGAISGTPVGAGPASFRVRATDGSGTSGTADLSIAVVQALAIHTLTISDAVVGHPYTAVLQAVGGRGEYGWRITGGDGAAWLTISSAGALSGMPLAAGVFSVTVEVSDASGQEITREFMVTVLGDLAVADLSLPVGVEGRAYAAQLVAVGGDGAYSWTVTGGTLPAGIMLQTGGALTGTPSVAGAFGFTVEVEDGGGRVASRELSLTVERAPTIATTILPPADLGVEYATQLVATGGTGTYTWSLAGGVLPAGLTLSAAGSITGTPTAQGSSAFSVRVTDQASRTHVRALTIVVAEIQQVTSGFVVTDIAGGTGSQRYYGIAVPSGAERLTVTISGGTGDADLYLRRGALPSEFTYDCRPLRQGNAETCEVSAPAADQWYIMVRAFAAYTGLRLEVTVQQ